MLACFSMDGSKAPSPDGFTAHFFQHNWDFAREDVWQAAKGFFGNGFLLKELNSTISLCNVIYKILSKVLALRLKPLLHKIISPQQNAFVPGRSTQDNIIVAHECLNAMRRRRRGRTGSLALKLDMFKAYDCVKWPFLLEVLKRMVFNEKWCKWVEECIITVRYSIQINGK